MKMALKIMKGLTEKKKKKSGMGPGFKAIFNGSEG